MKKTIYIVSFLAFSLLLVLVFVRPWSGPDRSGVVEHGLLALPESPLDATFEIEGHQLMFTSGKAELEEDRVSFTVRGDPVYGDVNGDGLEDAVLLVVSEKGGDEKIQYIVLALKDTEGGYMGMNGVSLDPERTLKEFAVRDELVVLTYEGETQDAEEYLTLSHITLQKFTRGSGEDSVVAGTLSYNSDTPVIELCDSGRTYTVSPESNSFAALRAIHTERTNTSDHTSVYLVVAGHIEKGDEFDNTQDVATEQEVPDGQSEKEEGGLTKETFLVRAVLSAPKEGVCRTTPPEEEHTVEAEEITESEESEETVLPEIQGEILLDQE